MYKRKMLHQGSGKNNYKLKKPKKTKEKETEALTITDTSLQLTETINQDIEYESIGNGEKTVLIKDCTQTLKNKNICVGDIMKFKYGSNITEVTIRRIEEFENYRRALDNISFESICPWSIDMAEAEDYIKKSVTEDVPVVCFHFEKKM